MNFNAWAEGTEFVSEQTPPATSPQMPVPQPPGPQMLSRSAAAGIMRLMLFNERLKTRRAMDMDYWVQLAADFFSPHARLKLNLWDDEAQQNRSFEILKPNIARLFWTYHHMDLDEMTFHLENPREFLKTQRQTIVICPKAKWTCLFLNGIKVVNYGCLRAAFDISSTGMRMSLLEFHARRFMEYVPRIAITGNTVNRARSMDQYLPSPINQFGVPLRVMRCLEISEICADMDRMISVAAVNDVGPMQAISQLLAAPDPMELLQQQHQHHHHHHHHQQLNLQQQQAASKGQFNKRKNSVGDKDAAAKRRNSASTVNSQSHVNNNR